MFILVISRGLPTKKYPGNGIFEWDQTKALRTAGNKVIYVALDMRSIRRIRKFGLIHESVDNIEVYNCNVPLGRVSKVLLRFFSWFMFKRAYKRIVKTHGKPDIIHAHFGRGTGRIALKAKKKYGVDYVITEHESALNKDDVTAKDKSALKEIYSNAKVRIAVSPMFCNRLKNLYHENFEFVPNIVDIAAFSSSSRIAHEKINFVSVGMLTGYRKGMDLLIKSFAKVKEANNKIGELIIIGDGKNRKDLQNLAETEGVGQYVCFKGLLPRQKIAEVFATSDIFVLASRNETFGVVYIEAMCAGLPVIATRCGGPEGLFTESEGLYVDVDDVEGLSEAMLYIAENLDKYDPSSIKKFCMDNYSPDVVAEKILKTVENNVTD